MKAYDRFGDAMVACTALPGVPDGTRGVLLNDLRTHAFEMGFYAATRPAPGANVRMHWATAAAHRAPFAES